MIALVTLNKTSSCCKTKNREESPINKNCLKGKWKSSVGYDSKIKCIHEAANQSSLSVAIQFKLTTYTKIVYDL